MVDHFCPFTSNLVFVKLLKSLEVGYQLVLVIGNEPIFWAPNFPHKLRVTHCFPMVFFQNPDGG